MKFLVFYTIYEWKRKTWRALSVFFMIGMILFCITSLLILLASNTLAYEITDSGSSLDPFSSKSFYLLIATHFILLLTGMLVLSDHKRTCDTYEDQVIKTLGVGTRKMVLLQLFETTISFLLSCPLFIALAVIFMRFFTQYLNHRLQNDSLSFRVPFSQILFSVLVLLIASMLGAVLPYIRGISKAHILPNGTPDATCSTAVMFWKIAHARWRSKYRSSVTVLAVIQILPLIFLIAAMSFGTIPEPKYDCTISALTEEKNKPFISQTIFEQITQLDGIQDIDVNPEDVRILGGYSVVRIKFENEFCETGIQALRELPTMEQYEVRDNFHTTQQTSTKNQIYRCFFLIISGVQSIAVWMLMWIILQSVFQTHDENMLIMHTLGMKNVDIYQFYRLESIYHMLSTGLPAILLAAIVFVVMESEGGGNKPIGLIFIVSVLYLCVQLLLSIAISRNSYKHFLKKTLQKTFDNRRAWNEYHM